MQVTWLKYSFWNPAEWNVSEQNRNTTVAFSNVWHYFLNGSVPKKSLEKLLGSDVQCFCQPDEGWQKNRTNGETGCTLLEDNPVWYADDQKSWFANFCIASKWPWNDTMDCKQQTDRDLGWWLDVTAEVNVLNADGEVHDAIRSRSWNSKNPNNNRRYWQVSSCKQSDY